MHAVHDFLWKSWAIVVLSGDCTSWMGGWEKQSCLDTEKDGHALVEMAIIRQWKLMMFMDVDSYHPPNLTTRPLKNDTVGSMFFFEIAFLRQGLLYALVWVWRDGLPWYHYVPRTMSFPVGNGGGCSLPFKDYRRTLLMDKILHQFIQFIRSIYHIFHSLSCLKHLNWCRMLPVSFRKSLTRNWDNPLKLVNYMILSNSS